MAPGVRMSGGTMVWLTDNELKLLEQWYWNTVVGEVNTLEDDALKEKLEARREELACRA